MNRSVIHDIMLLEKHYQNLQEHHMSYHQSILIKHLKQRRVLVVKKIKLLVRDINFYDFVYILKDINI